jgi:hypothetical protein
MPDFSTEQVSSGETREEAPSIGEATRTDKVVHSVDNGTVGNSTSSTAHQQKTNVASWQFATASEIALYAHAFALVALFSGSVMIAILIMFAPSFAALGIAIGLCFASAFTVLYAAAQLFSKSSLAETKFEIGQPISAPIQGSSKEVFSHALRAAHLLGNCHIGNVNEQAGIIQVETGSPSNPRLDQVIVSIHQTSPEDCEVTISSTPKARLLLPIPFIDFGRSKDNKLRVLKALLEASGSSDAFPDDYAFDLRHKRIAIGVLSVCLLLLCSMIGIICWYDSLAASETSTRETLPPLQRSTAQQGGAPAARESGFSLSKNGANIPPDWAEFDHKINELVSYALAQMSDSPERTNLVAAHSRFRKALEAQDYAQATASAGDIRGRIDRWSGTGDSESAVTSADDEDGTGAESTASSPTTAQNVREEILLGDITYVVDSPSLIPSTEQPKVMLVFVPLSVRNHGNQSHNVFANSFHLVCESGEAYDYDFDASAKAENMGYSRWWCGYALLQPRMKESTTLSFKLPSELTKGHLYLSVAEAGGSGKQVMVLLR